MAYSYVGLWITLSAGVIMYNKYVLSYFGFPFPVALTMVSETVKVLPCSSPSTTSSLVRHLLRRLHLLLLGRRR